MSCSRTQRSDAGEEYVWYHNGGHSLISNYLTVKIRHVKNGVIPFNREKKAGLISSQDLICAGREALEVLHTYNTYK